MRRQAKGSPPVGRGLSAQSAFEPSSQERFHAQTGTTTSEVTAQARGSSTSASIAAVEHCYGFVQEGSIGGHEAGDIAQRARPLAHFFLRIQPATMQNGFGKEGEEMERTEVVLVRNRCDVRGCRSCRLSKCAARRGEQHEPPHLATTSADLMSSNHCNQVRPGILSSTVFLIDLRCERSLDQHQHSRHAIHATHGNLRTWVANTEFLRCAG